MTTVGQFNRVWEDYTRKACLFFPTDEFRSETGPLFRSFADAFSEQFGASVQAVDSIPQDREITGTTLERLRGWVECVNRAVSEDYLAWCGLR